MVSTQNNVVIHFLVRCGQIALVKIPLSSEIQRNLKRELKEKYMLVKN